MMIEKKTTIRTVKVSCPFRYHGNLIILVLLLIIWLPVGVLLLLKNGNILTNKSKFYLVYYGSWSWLFFWGVIFFPIAILLMIFKGFDIVQEESLVEDEVIIERY